ncbi:hemoglobin subunit alpha-D-like [Sphaerodactylus townsendi]|uniref:hemoglobin subunit alpha-D-like n=1 Tax=Sphaerodactylus townsendi TaxID=933632 RepID=UPI002026A19B|nr:hemoglobin subunit alpha-D-like [Sphaerodactylus townsendi]
MLTAEDRRILKQSWEKVANIQEEIGCEALTRLFAVYPTSKTYFPHFDLSPGSAHIRSHGKKVIKALEDALNNADHLHESMAELSNLHAYNLRVDPVNFQFLARCIQVVLATHLRGDFNAQVYVAWDKFLCCVIEVLAEKYR